MKRRPLLIIIPILLFAGLFFLLRNIPSPSQKTRRLTILPETNMMRPGDNTMEETDGPEQRQRHEYLMTVDPATLEVPTERLRIAEEIIENTPRTEASNIVWQERGPSNIGGRTRAILIDKSDATGNTVWAGGVGGGLWKTTDFKTTCTWTRVTGISITLAITCIAQHPSTFGTIYLGSGEGFSNIDAIRGLGVYKTTDGGANWALLASTTTGGTSVSNFYFVNKLLVYTNGDVYAATRSNFCNTGGGIMKSVDGGTSWTRVIGTSAGTCATSADATGYDIEKSASGDLYAATRTPNSTGKIWKSPAGGTVGDLGTWSNVTPTGTFQRIELACSPSDNNKIYALTQGAGSGTGGTRLSTDGGGSWSNINVGTWCDQGSSNADFTRGQAWYDLILGIKPDDDATVYAGGIDIFKTTNSGTAWAQISQWASGCPVGPGEFPYVHADIHAFEFMPTSANEMVVGCDGGIFYTTDGGTTFTDKNGGYNVTQYYGIAIHPTSGSDYLLGGSQDNGSHKFTTSGINSVTTVSGGDGAFCHIDTDNPLYQYTSFTGTNVNFSSDGGVTFNYLGGFATDRFINPSDYDPATDHLYCGGAVRNLRRVYNFTTTMAANSFTIASTTNHSVSALKVDPNTANRVWVAFSTADGAAAFATPELYIVDNPNNPNTPTSTAVTLPAGIATSGNYISSIDIENGDATHVILTLSNFGVTSVWETTNGGTSWASVEGDLPDMPVRWCAFMPAGLSPNTRGNAVGGVLLATELGVWSTNLLNGVSTAWVANSTGIGNVRTDMIRIRASDNKIAVGTHGRGMFTGTHTSSLPVSLLEFKGTLQNKSVFLQWSTSAEYNSKQFELEKSFDGTSFRRIAIVPAAGNSNSTLHYSYTDREPLTEMNYYRLRSVDIDGASKLSQVVLIKVPYGKQEMLVLGNPFKENIVVRFVKATEEKGELKLFDMAGTLIALQRFGQGAQLIEFSVNGQKLQSGVYVLQAMIGNEKLVRRVLKE